MSLVGDKAETAVWLVVQHAGHDLEFQKRGLALLEEAAGKNEAPKSQVAYLTDRVRVAQGEKQLFGTQFKADEDGKYMPYLIEDEENIDQRRSEYDLMPFAEYKKGFEERHDKDVKA